jgi:hypothetical protein
LVCAPGWGRRREQRLIPRVAISASVLRTPEFLIADGAAGLERVLAVLWPEVPVQRCTVHNARNLLAHAPDARCTRRELVAAAALGSQLKVVPSKPQQNAPAQLRRPVARRSA